MRGPVAVLLILLAACNCRGQLSDSLGSPGELAWNAWLLMDPQPPSSHHRRITPKSVFIAPAFAPEKLPPCPDGHYEDSGCSKLVQVNQTVQLDLLLKRLNALYGSPGVTESSAPLKIALPIDTATIDPASNDDQSVEVSVVMADVKRSSDNSSSEEDQDSTDNPVISLWSIKNDTNPNLENISLSMEVPDSPSKDVDLSSYPFQIPILPPSEVLTPTDMEESLPMLVLSPQPSFELQSNSSHLEESNMSGSSNFSLEENVESDSANGSVALEPKQNDDMSSVVNDVPLENNNTKTSNERPTSSDEDSVDLSSRLDVMIDNGDSVENKTDIVSSQMSDEIGLSDELKNSTQTNSDVNEEEVIDTSDTSDQALAASFPDVDDGIDHKRTKHKYRVDGSEIRPAQGFVRFPSEEAIDSAENTHTVHLFKGNYVKFPVDESHTNKPLPQPVESFPHHKQTLWWLPEGWRLDQQRQRPTLMRFWSRMPMRADISMFSRNNPSFGQQSPLPYRHQSSYAPNWGR